MCNVKAWFELVSLFVYQIGSGYAVMSAFRVGSTFMVLLPVVKGALSDVNISMLCSLCSFACMERSLASWHRWLSFQHTEPICPRQTTTWCCLFHIVWMNGRQYNDPDRIQTDTSINCLTGNAWTLNGKKETPHPVSQCTCMWSLWFISVFTQMVHCARNPCALVPLPKHPESKHIWPWPGRGRKC